MTAANRDVVKAWHSCALWMRFIAESAERTYVLCESVGIARKHADVSARVSCALSVRTRLTRSSATGPLHPSPTRPCAAALSGTHVCSRWYAHGMAVMVTGGAGRGGACPDCMMLDVRADAPAVLVGKRSLLPYTYDGPRTTE